MDSESGTIGEMEEKIQAITILVKEIGWGIAIPEGGGKEDDGMLHGLIIGEQSYIDYILKHLD